MRSWTGSAAIGGGVWAARLRAAVVLAGIFLGAAAVAVHPAAAQPDQAEAQDPPGPAVERLVFRAFDVDRAPRELEAGQMDLYLYSLKTAAARRLEGNTSFRLYQAPATSVSLLLNPAPAPEGELNPFALPEVRRAVQYVVDRTFIARDIYQGMAVPMITHVSRQDPDYLTVYDLDRGSGLTYDPEYARRLIAEAMKAAGAERVGGIWRYRGRPVVVKLIARVEDERREIGDLVRSELEQAGFQVAMAYLPFAAAVLTVYSSDPQAFQWHLYTEGWGRSAPQRYDFATVNQMTAAWMGNMPGWQEVGFWQYRHPELDELGKRLFRGEFTSLEERNRIYRRMTELGLEESVRIWLVTVVNSFPASTALADVTLDLVAGPRSPWTLRAARVPGREDLVVGNQWVWTERTTWNPVGGFGDVYSIDVWRNLYDPPLWNHPFTGRPMPFRADFEVKTAGPEGKLEVPEDAVLWNAGEDRWAPVGPGTQAASRVTFDYSRYVGSRWHHGQPVTLADLLYSVAQGWELAYDRDKARIEVALGVTARPYLETFRGFRLLDDHRLEVYVDYWHFDPSTIASYASPGGLSMPWEVLAALDDLVFAQRRAAYSDTAAARFNVPWLSLVMERDARLVQRTLRTLLREKRVPEGVFEVGGQSLVTPEEAAARYQAALDWFDRHGHLVISNGPFYLAAYDPPAQYAELRAFRDPSYPFEPGDWRFGAPPELAIELPGPGGGRPALRPGEPLTLEVAVRGPGRLGLRYLLVDPATRQVVAQGEAAPVDGGADRAVETGRSAEAAGTDRFRITLAPETTAQLFPGLYQLHLAAFSDALARLEEAELDVEVEP
ncbi:ABC transporter substrate-binding protein [Limnochorda pilosa]|uniref:ABC transporter substrate-binding protein n=1 Tax=Limnochorda pilosa TaxID=1555112 RepID=UPI0009E6B9AB|nr:ABC transporter substrate-binding protein [Limnochorda pilosa]